MNSRNELKFNHNNVKAVLKFLKTNIVSLTGDELYELENIVANESFNRVPW